ncbi:MAG: SPOR domain-containing protein [Gammaproteobacteria bacterium]|nr:SPOR domain-containing protein [Gammaproteobacteria bacterium]
MKWLVLLLLIANAVYLGWELDRQSRANIANADASLPVAWSAKKLALLEELESPPVARVEEMPVEPAPEPEDDAGDLVTQLPDISMADVSAESVEYSCFTFGPLPEEKHVLWLGDWFHARRSPASARAAQDPDRRLFWVYLEQTSRAGADATMADLQKKGVRDYRLINRGDLVNSISLGLFSTQATVNARLQELKEKGFKPVVVPYSNLQQIYWLDVQVPASGSAIDEMFRGLPSRYHFVPVRCDQIAINRSAP